MLYHEYEGYPPQDPEGHVRSEYAMRRDRDNYMDCPGCGSPYFYMGDPFCRDCGWNGH